MMKRSIKWQMISLFVGLTVAMMAMVFVINVGFLEKYYINNKEKEFINIYEEMRSLSDGDLLEDVDTLEELDRLAEKKNVSLLVVDADWGKYHTTEHDPSFLWRRLQGWVFGKMEGTVMEETVDYQIVRFRVDVGQVEYLSMFGTLDTGNTFMLQCPLESIRESVKLFNRFVGIMGITIIAVSIVLAWFFSKRITKPLMELTTLSTKMTELDFDAKYTSGGENEISVLGHNFNQMSEKLESTISDLKKANYELQKDIEQKEKIESMRSEFLANVSHELKTPIALIQGYAEGLKEGINDDPESREFYCDVIMDEAGKMNRMVRNLLTLNQLEFGEDNVQFERFDVTDLIRGVIASSEIMIRQKEAKVVFCQETPVYVWADEFKAEQVIRNYFNNALNHLGGERVIEIKIEVQSENARISVFNTGTPIPEEDVAHIWEKFYKVDKARTREYGGNGIGLSIVKAIMESFHKEYGVENYNNGVKFWFELDRN